MTNFAKTAPKSRSLTGMFALLAGVVHFGRLPRQWTARRRSRIALAQLDPHLTRDIGLDAVTRDAEAQRPFWR